MSEFLSDPLERRISFESDEDYGGDDFGDGDEQDFDEGDLLDQGMNDDQGDEEEGQEEEEEEDEDEEDDDGDVIYPEDEANRVKMSDDVRIVESVVDKQLIEIGSQAVWSVSSAKPGFGVQRLRDGSKKTFWQSDSVQPHNVDVQFNKKVSLACIALLLDINSDESYTPLRVSISGGSTVHDLKVFRRDDIDLPNGWVVIPLIRAMTSNDAAAMFDEARANEAPRLSLLRVEIVANYDNGRDSRIRGLQVFAPRIPAYVARGVPQFTSDAMVQWTGLR